MAGRRDRDPGLDPDLERALEGVEPLSARARIGSRVPSEPCAPAPPPVEMDVQVEGEAVQGTIHGLDRRVLRRLRRQAPEAQVDLHGLRRDQARAAVERLLGTPGVRCVLIIHGRGAHSEAGPVLKDDVIGWITEGASARRVLAFTTAPPNAGGAGALLVLLRR